MLSPIFQLSQRNGLLSVETQRVECLYPESAILAKNEGLEKEFFYDMEKDSLINLFLWQESSDHQHIPLRQIHFGISRHADCFPTLEQGNRRHSLFYQSNVRDAYVTLNGVISIVEDPEVRIAPPPPRPGRTGRVRGLFWSRALGRPPPPRLFGPNSASAPSAGRQ